jgi:putative phage-type endonuclease
MTTKPDPPLFFTNGKTLEEAANPKVVELWRKEQFEQRSPEWFEARMKGISASDCSLALTMDDNACDYYIECYNLQEEFKKNPKKCCNKYSTPKTLYVKKCMRTDTGSSTSNPAMLWGQKYEAIVQTIYSQMIQEDVVEFGLLFHPKVPFLMASPDGITTSGTMLEIKCPSQRKVGPVPPLYYFHQMLMQLECCGLDVCDFFDCSFYEYLFEEEWLNDAKSWWEKRDTVSEELQAKSPHLVPKKHHIFGILLVNPLAKEDKYTYAPPTVYSPEEFLAWSEKVMGQSLIDEEIELQRVYYKLDDYRIVEVRRSPDFFERNLPKFTKVWNEIEHYRTPEGKDAYEAFVNAGKRKTPTTTSQTKLTDYFESQTMVVDVELGPAKARPSRKTVPPFTAVCLC